MLVEILMYWNQMWDNTFDGMHRRNNHRDRGRQVPPNFWFGGDQQCIGPPQLFGHNFEYRYMQEICMKPTRCIIMRQCNIFDCFWRLSHSL